MDHGYNSKKKTLYDSATQLDQEVTKFAKRLPYIAAGLLLLLVIVFLVFAVTWVLIYITTVGVTHFLHYETIFPKAQWSAIAAMTILSTLLVDHELLIYSRWYKLNMVRVPVLVLVICASLILLF